MNIILITIFLTANGFYHVNGQSLCGAFGNIPCANSVQPACFGAGCSGSFGVRPQVLTSAPIITNQVVQPVQTACGQGQIYAQGGCMAAALPCQQSVCAQPAPQIIQQAPQPPPQIIPQAPQPPVIQLFQPPQVIPPNIQPMPPTIITVPGSSSGGLNFTNLANFTNTINITNVANSTNINNVITNINSTNVNNIKLDSTSNSQSTSANTPSKEDKQQCCVITEPNECKTVNNQWSCTERKRHVCGRQCDEEYIRPRFDRPVSPPAPVQPIRVPYPIYVPQPYPVQQPPQIKVVPQPYPVPQPPQIQVVQQPIPQQQICQQLPIQQQAMCQQSIAQRPMIYQQQAVQQPIFFQQQAVQRPIMYQQPTTQIVQQQPIQQQIMYQRPYVYPQQSSCYSC